MKRELLTKEKNIVSVKMSFEAAELEQSVEEAYRKSRGKYSVDGFRKGKAPRKIIEMKYGEGVFLEDAINNLFSKEYPNAVEEFNLDPIDRPDVDFEEYVKGENFIVTFKVQVSPEFEIKEYKGVKIKKAEYLVSENDILKELESVQSRNSRMLVVEREAKDGDTVLIDYSGFLGDEQFEGGTAEKHPLVLGSNSFIPGFEEKLVGVKAGDEVDVDVTFPEEYHSKDLAGKAVVFKVLVHEIKEKELPEIDDEFAKEVSEFDSLDEYKEDIKKRLEKDAASKGEYEMRNAVLEKIYDENDVEIPEVMIEDQLDEMIEEFSHQLTYQGMNMETYLKYRNTDLPKMKEEIKPEALKKVKTKLLMEAVAKAENIEVTDEDVEKEFNSMAAQYNMDLEKIKKDFGERNKKYMKQDIRLRKAVDFVYDNAKIEDKK